MVEDLRSHHDVKSCPEIVRAARGCLLREILFYSSSTLSDYYPTPKRNAMKKWGENISSSTQKDVTYKRHPAHLIRPSAWLSKRRDVTRTSRASIVPNAF